MTDAEIEAVARAIHATDPVMLPWHKMSDAYKKMTRREAEAAITALDSLRNGERRG